MNKFTVVDLLKLRAGTPWTCVNGHYLGVTVSRRTGGRWLTQLLLFRNAATTISDAVEINALVEGTVRDIMCSVCETPVMRTWYHVKDDQKQ
jgi:hypothetical protein